MECLASNKEERNQYAIRSIEIEYLPETQTRNKGAFNLNSSEFKLAEFSKYHLYSLFFYNLHLKTSF